MNASKSGVIINIIANGQPSRKAKVVREPKSYKDMVIPCQVPKYITKIQRIFKRKWFIDNYKVLYFSKGVTTRERALINANEYRTAEISTVGSALAC